MEEGEGNISIYTKLEKIKGEENLICSLENDDGQIQEGTENIKNTTFNLFSKLYTNEPEIESYQDEFLEKIEKVLSVEDRDFLEAPIIKQEIKSSLNSLQNNKTNGNKWFYKIMLCFL